MLCYVAVSLADEFENKSILNSKEKKEKRTLKHSFSWDEERLKLLLLLVHLSNLELVQLWEPPAAPMMEDWSTLSASFCYKLLENPTVVRDKLLLDNIAELLGLAVQKYGLTLSK